MSAARVAVSAGALLVLCAAACDLAGELGGASSKNAAASAAPAELERLAFVPRGRTPRESPVQVGSDVDLLVDRYEVTRAHWSEVAGAERAAAAPAAIRDAPWGGGAANDLPATHVTIDEAIRFAELRGMRVPSIDEWLWIAVGPRSAAYPFGRPRAAVANTLELGLGRTTPVGTFESGRTPETGLYDVHGNVRELVLGRGRSRAMAAGGSYETPMSPTFGRLPVDVILADEVADDARLPDVGLRCVTDAAVWLRAHAAAWSEPARRAAITRVGARWGPRAAMLLAELSAEPGAPKALTWLLEGAR